MRPVRISVTVSFAIAVALFLHCSIGPVAGGNSSETTNGVTVVASAGSLSGETVPGAFVGLYARDYVAYLNLGFSDTMVAAANGEFAFGGLEPGYYNLLVMTADSQSAGLVAGVPVSTDSSFETGIDSLTAPGSIRGTVAGGKSWAVAFIRGTPFTDLAKADGSFEMRGVPEGTYMVVVVGDSATTGSPLAVADSGLVKVTPGATSTW